MIPFNNSLVTGKEIEYIRNVLLSGHISGNGLYTGSCHSFFQNRYNIQGCFLTTSCTAALEMAAILLDIKPGDEVIVPSYTFVSTALAFYRQGAVIKFIDSSVDNPCLDETLIESLINEKTRVIVPVHYSGIACNMDLIIKIANKYGLFIVEDAAHAIESYFNGKPLGTIGDLGCFSFHATKPIHCGEGGLLAINNGSLLKRAEMVWEKGTNKLQYISGEVDQYEWCDVGSSFLPSELNAAFLRAQLDNIDKVINKRKNIWELYNEEFKRLEEQGYLKLPVIPEYATVNGYGYFFMLNSLQERVDFLEFMKSKGIICLSHFLPLHKSKFYKNLHDGRTLYYSELYAQTLVRLPLYYALDEEKILYITAQVKDFFKGRK